MVVQRLIEAAVEERLKAQSDKKYYEDKYKSEKAKVEAAKEAANVLEVEFTVSVGPGSSTCSNLN